MRGLDIAVIFSSIAWGLNEWTLMLFSRRNEKKATDNKSYTLLIILISVSLGICVSVVARASDMRILYSSSPLFPYIGFACILLGIALRWTAFFTLKNHFTTNVTIQADHQLIKKGPYKYIRHPAYLGSMISFLGLGLCYANWLSLIIILVPYAMAILRKINFEEEALERHFSVEYSKYRDATKKILPFIY
jgi:protein-S-isoprenylcysteine O-methyltransferase Ste14